jgi:hypothetical protein
MIDVEEWMRYFAVNTLLANQETSLGNGYGEDYAMYCGKLDRRFKLLCYDLDSILGCGMRTNIFNDGIWRMNNLPVVKRFITHNAFAPLYLKTLRELAEGLFAPENLNPLLDNVLGDWVGPKEVERMKAFNANQVAYVLSLIPGKFEVTSTFEITKGYPTVTRSDVVFSGKADAVRTGSVLVNGLPAQYTAWKGEWSIALDLHPGVNLLVTQAYDSEGREIAYNESYILYETGALPNEINLATLETDMTLTAAEGPWQINSDLMIGKGVTLQIEPGTAVYFGPNVRVSMGRNARILAEGTREKPIVFSGIPGGQRWRYILLNHVGVTDAVGNPENRFSYVHVKDNTSFFLYALYGSFYLDHLTFGTVGVTYLNMEGCSLMVSNCRFPGSDRPVQLVRAVKGTLQNGRRFSTAIISGILPGPMTLPISPMVPGSSLQNISSLKMFSWAAAMTSWTWMVSRAGSKAISSCMLTRIRPILPWADPRRSAAAAMKAGPAPRPIITLSAIYSMTWTMR